MANCASILFPGAATLAPPCEESLAWETQGPTAWLKHSSVRSEFPVTFVWETVPVFGLIMYILAPPYLIKRIFSYTFPWLPHKLTVEILCESEMPLCLHQLWKCDRLIACQLQYKCVWRSIDYCYGPCMPQHVIELVCVTPHHPRVWSMPSAMKSAGNVSSNSRLFSKG